MGIFARFGSGAGNVNERVIFFDPEVTVDLLFRYLWVVNVNFGLLFDEVTADVDRRGLAGVVGVLFEGEAEEGDLFACDGIEKGLTRPLYTSPSPPERTRTPMPSSA